jgi:immune inhibitor A
MRRSVRGSAFQAPEWLGLLYVLVSLLISSACSPFSSAAPLATPTPSAGSVVTTNENLTQLLQAERLVLSTPHPPRDLYSLAERLKLHSAQPLPHSGRQTPLHEQLGQEDFFWVNDLDTQSYKRIRARLVYITAHVYMYVEDGQSVSQAAIQASANLFEERIYPSEHAIFGSEWSPGIDDDVHLTILNATGLGNGVGGYFSSADEYPTTINPYSNEREMFYINLDDLLPGTTDYNSTLAHELQHMIHWYLHASDPSWVNEGMSMLAQHITGFGVDGVDTAFLQQPTTQLTTWSNDMNAALAHYGAAYLFMDYFAEHYGGYSILTELLHGPAGPPLSFDHVLARHGYKDRFIDVVNKWYIANFVQDYSIDKGEYGYATIHLAKLIPQEQIGGYPFLLDGSIPQYAAQYYQFDPAGHHGTLTLSLNGNPAIPMLDNQPYHSLNEWWSNRDDNMDSTLTRSFDLSALKGQHVTLQFAAWFELERDYDYAFVEVSTDGKNWTTLKGQYTTTDNPNGANWGNGYTGISGGGTRPQWIQESIDLTPYAGKKIQLRFEEVTDDAVNLQGLAIDWIRIPQLHYEDDLVGNDGWVSNGFIRFANLLPEHYTMQALVYQGQQFSVRRVDAASGNGRATLVIPDFGSKVTRVVLIVSAWAAETTLPAHYHLTAQLGI